MIPLKRRKLKLDAKISRQQALLSQLQQKRLAFGLSIFFLLIASQIFKGFSLELVAIFIPLPLFIFFFRKSRAKKLFITQLSQLSGFYQHQYNFQNGENFTGSITNKTINPDLVRDLDLHELSSTLVEISAN